MKRKNIIKNSSLNQAIKNNINNKLDIISEIPLMKNLNYIMVNELTRLLKEKTYKMNEYLLKQNDPIDDIYIILKGKFILSLNHQIEFNIEHDINTFINYQNITHEPFNVDRNYEITGKINDKNEINLFIYNVRSFFGDIELLSKSNKSLFNIKCIEEESVVGIIDRINFLDIIEKVKLEFKENTEYKLDLIQKRVKDILNQKSNLNYDRLKLNKERISYQLIINHNYKLIIDKLEKIRNNINENNYNKIRNIKLDTSNYAESKSNNQNLFITKNKPIINRSKSEINNYEKNITNLFKFPTVIKNDTKIIFDNFFENVYNKNKIKKFTLNEIKFDYEPVYLNKFENLSNLTPQKKFEFLYHMKNHLDRQLKTPGNINKNKNRSKLNNLLLMYNHYITNQNQNKSGSKLSGFIYENEPIKNRSFGVLNPEIKNNLMSKEENQKNKIIFQKKKPIKLEIIKFQTPLLDRYNISKNKNISNNEKSNSKSTSKLFFNSILSEEIKKSSFNFNPKKTHISYHNDKIIFENSHLKENKNNHHIIKKQKLKKEENNNANITNNTNVLKKNKRRFSIAPPNLNNTTMYKNSKIKSKNIFDMLLKNRYESQKNHFLYSFHLKSSDDDNDNDDESNTNNKRLFVNINNNIDIKNEDFVKQFFSRNKFVRANTYRIIK